MIRTQITATWSPANQLSAARKSNNQYNLLNHFTTLWATFTRSLTSPLPTARGSNSHNIIFWQRLSTPTLHSTTPTCNIPPNSYHNQMIGTQPRVTLFRSLTSPLSAARESHSYRVTHLRSLTSPLPASRGSYSYYNTFIRTIPPNYYN